MAEKKKDNKGEELVSPREVYFYSLSMMFIIILPLTIGISYIFDLGYKLFHGPREYSVLFGIGMGILLSILFGYIYGYLGIKELNEKDKS